MFSCMVKIHNLGRLGEVVLNDMANPAGPVPQNHDFLCSLHSTAVGQGIEDATKLFDRQTSGHILGGSGLIQKDAWHQFRTLTARDAFKNRSHFDLTMDIA